MLSTRIVSSVVLGIALGGLPLSLQLPTGTGRFVAMVNSPVHAAELEVRPSGRSRHTQRRHAVRVSRLEDPYCGGPYVGGGYHGGTYYGGPWIDLRCFEGSALRLSRSSTAPY